MKILVTGGAGYIGSVVVRMLLDAGYAVVVFDDLSTGHADAVTVELIQGDLCKAGDIAAAMKSVRPDAIMHFAARSLVGESCRDPRKYFHDNVVGAIHLLDAALDNKVSRFILSSTAAVYGAPRQTPIPESAVLCPTNPYGHSKLTIERMLAAYEAAYGLKYVSLRYFNAAGAVPEHGLGERHDPETHLIPIVLQVAAGVRTCIDVFGDNYETPDGTCIRDYIHVLDLADAHVRALRKLTSGSNSATLNVGTGQGNSVREVIDVACEVTGREIPHRIVAGRDGDPPVLVADAQRAVAELGWSPQYELKHIIRSAWDFYRAHPTIGELA